MASHSRNRNNNEKETSSSEKREIASPGIIEDRMKTRSANNYAVAAAKLQYEMLYMHVEDHKSPIFCVQFNYFIKDLSIFACVANNRVSIYECEPNGKLKFLQVYADAEEKEKFYTCAWSLTNVDGKNESILAVAGLRGVIRIIRPLTMTCINREDMKHSGEINELKFHPTKYELLLSASQDLTIKLWNVDTSVLVVIFGGVEGHRDGVLSVDLNEQGDFLVSCGIDHAIKCWKLDTTTVQDAIQRSNKFDAARSQRSFNTYVQNYPDYSTRDVHANYMDCIRWFGSLLISKSNDNTLKFWKPNLDEDDTKSVLFHDTYCENCDLWFLKFSMDFSQKVLALGNRTGKIFVWNLDTPDPRSMLRITLTHPRCTTTIRHTALNREALILIGVGDDGSIWRWDRVLTSKGS